MKFQVAVVEAGLPTMLRCLAQMLVFTYYRSEVNCDESHCGYLVEQDVLMRAQLMENYLLDFLSRKSMKQIWMNREKEN